MYIEMEVAGCVSSCCGCARCWPRNGELVDGGHVSAFILALGGVGELCMCLRMSILSSCGVKTRTELCGGLLGMGPFTSWKKYCSFLYISRFGTA